MDDILASIRKIISDDEARAQVGPQSAPGQSTRPTVLSPAARTREQDDVLLLTDLVEEPKPMEESKAMDEPKAKVPESRPVAVAPPRIDPVSAADMPQPSVGTPSDALLGASVVGATASAFSRLNQAVQDSVPPPAADNPGPTIGASGKTIEDLVKEMLRTMLKEWLDKNLPSMVERYVEREIARLTRR